MSAISPERIALDRPTLVEASAGTGKTHAITTYFVRAILEDGLSPEQILIVTYTKAATAELRVRARARIGKALQMIDRPPEEPDALQDVVTEAVALMGRREVERRLRRAISDMDRAAISTIHGFCQRLLQDYPLSFEVGLDIEVAENVAALHGDLAVDFWTSELYARPAWFFHALRDAKVDIEHLKKLARTATTPGIEILGPDPAPLDESVLQSLIAAKDEARRLWELGRDEILALLSGKGMNGRTYSSKRLTQTLPQELDDLFAETGPSKLPERFESLCTSGLRVNKGHEAPRHPFFDACEALQTAHEVIAPMIAYEIFELQRRFCAFVETKAEARRNDAALYSFDDLLNAVHDAVASRPAVAALVREAYPLALVDEFQDTDSVQYGLFRAVYGEARAVYVGDPKQAIYAFRGADVYSYLRAANEVGTSAHTLDTNRRSDPGLVNAVNTLFSRQSPPFVIDGIRFRPARAHETRNRSSLSPPFEIVVVDADDLASPREERVAEIVANEVAWLLASGATIEERSIAPGDVAVLCRTNKQAVAVTEALRRVDVPVTLDGDASVLDTEVAKDLLAVLEAALTPGDSRTVRRALLTSLVGISPGELAAMEDPAWTEWVARFRQWNESWHRYGILRCLEELLSHTEAEVTIAARSSAKRDLTDLLHLQELLFRGERERHLDPVALMQWFRRLGTGTPEGGMAAVEDLQQRVDADSGAVRITTLHKSKGLEYGVVFCPFPWGDAGLWKLDRKVVKFHDPEGELKLDLGSREQDAHRAQMERETLSEALRLLYVGFTRAKHRCTVFWGVPARLKPSALAYLLHGTTVGEKVEVSEIEADLRRLVADAGGTIGWRTPHAQPEESRGRASHPATLEARPETRELDQTPRIASFTSLTGHDEKAPGRPVPESTSPLFAELPGGVRTGLLLHAILEHADLETLGDEASAKLVARQLALHGFDPDSAESVLTDLVTLASTPLLDEPSLPPLAGLDTRALLRELEFTLDVTDPDLGSLAALLRNHGAPRSAPGYADRLTELRPDGIRGFLRGFIDLMFEWDGRWYVADYKSNRLPRYERDEVVEAMQRDHYVLQGLIYSAAAHRYLRHRIPDYDPAEHWGGALFLFLRGMTGPGGAGHGVYFDRASPALLRGVDDWLGGRHGAR